MVFQYESTQPNPLIKSSESLFDSSILKTGLSPSQTNPDGSTSYVCTRGDNTLRLTSKGNHRRYELHTPGNLFILTVLNNHIGVITHRRSPNYSLIVTSTTKPDSFRDTPMTVSLRQAITAFLSPESK